MSGMSRVGSNKIASLVNMVSVRAAAGLGLVDGVTVNQTGIVAAVAEAFGAGKELYWAPGTYVSTGNIPNFHDVVHVGPGVIKRGAVTYFITPRRDTHINALNVATTGNDDNDGISADCAIKTIQRACDVLQGDNALGKIAQGTWKVQIAAGTYAEGASWTRSATTANYVEFVGEVDGSNVPTTIIDGAASAKTAGLYFDGGPQKIKVVNVRSKNFRANSVASGVVFTNKGIAKVYTVNVWTDNNRWAGMNADSIGQFIVQGGTHDANTNYNLRVRGGVAISIGYNGSQEGQRVTLKNSVGASVQIRDASSGHFDYVDIINHPTDATGTGVWVTNVSRVVLNSCTMTNCNVGTIAENGATFGAVNTTYTNVPTEFRTSENASRDQDDGYLGGEGMAYDRFHRRYAIGLREWGSNPASSTAFALATAKTGFADIAFLAPDATVHRIIFGRTSNNAHMRLEGDCTLDRYSMIANGVAIMRLTPTEFNAGRDNTTTLGSGGARWSQLYAATGTIATSDERAKTDIAPLPAAVLRAWSRVEFCQYRFKDAVSAKGDGARMHFGVIAQQVKAAFEAEGLDAFAFGVLCFDEWEAQPEVVNEDGEVEQAARPAGNRYGIRYEEALALECAYLRSRLK